MNDSRKPLLTAEWRELALLNYEIAPALLAPRVPAGTELDSWRGRTLVSIVGFLFQDTRLFGVAIPLHRDFEEVNLRFYVRRKAADGWRRGVVFVKELVPRRAIALAARALYNEPYTAVAMSHRIETGTSGRSARYAWKFRGREHSLRVQGEGEPSTIVEGSEEEFVAEHYWGYTRQRDGSTLEYEVEHPRWRIRPAREAVLDCDVRALYGAEFERVLTATPTSAFLAEGSAVRVHRGVRLPSSARP
ncbi:MAG TPA: DUF2071 domain-containing protein [Planctomycetota bacterium]|nr:DUF2071 domain-containing protein [Planctomycetota bacterium]